MKNAFKVATVLATCFLTWLATSTIVAQQRKPPKVSIPATPVVRKVHTPDTDVPLLTLEEAAAQEKLGMANLKEYKVTVADGKATAFLDARVVNHRPGYSYIWRLRVVDVAKNPLLDAWYDHQVFQMPALGAMEPTFNEVFDLPAAADMVWVALYELPPGTDLDTFKRGPASGRTGAIAVRGVAYVNQ